MLFDSFSYWVFFSVVLVALSSLSDRLGRLALVLAGFIFYSFWNPRFSLLLGGSILANYLFGLWIGTTGETRRRTAVTLAIVFNLSLLCLFKYYTFFIDSAARLLAGANLNPWRLDITLPVGISFITFEGIAYAVDVYRRDTPPVRSLTNFGVFMSFFPHLVAGPIIRPAHFFPQLDDRQPLRDSMVKWGVVQVLKGLIKKMIFADYFAIIANAYFSHNLFISQPVPAALGVLAFSFQIYFDFAGYTDIARGCARLLGYDFPSNFERPYLSYNITDFWRRWHISLSTWLRDYIYIPLGGNRRGPLKTYINIIIVMALGGLWHGASWNFVIWGLYHGVLLLCHRAWIGLFTDRPLVNYPFGWLLNIASMLLTFIAVTVGWVPFRAPDFSATLRTLTELSSRGITHFLEANPAFTVLCLLPALYCFVDSTRRLERWLTDQAPLVVVAVFAAMALVLVETFGQFGLQVPFIYFQF